MEVASLATPSTAGRASSAGLSPPQNPMDDSDSSLTRKRPRLDSGDRSYKSMSADELSATPPGSTLPPPSTPTQKIHNDPNAGLALVSPLSQTPSKVTINVRDSGRGISQLPPSTSPQDDQAIPNIVETSANGHASSPDVISVSSSPMRSPEIEIAEIEDIEDHPGETRWRTLGEATELQITLLGQFPYHTPGRYPHETVKIIVEALELGKFRRGSRPFKEIGDWIEGFLESTESLGSQWRDMYLDQQDFWISLPSIVIMLASRRYGEPPFNSLVHNEEQDNREDLEIFLAAFAALVARMVKLDCITLDGDISNVDMDRDLVSDEYLHCLTISIQNGPLPAFWSLLQTSYGFDVHRLVTAIIVRFLGAPSHGMDCVSQFTRSLMRQSAVAPGLLGKIVHGLYAVRGIACFYRILQQDDSFDTAALQEPIQDLPTKAYRFFEAVDLCVKASISKQLSALSHSIAETLVTQLALLLSLVLEADEQLTAALVQNLPNVSDELASQFGRATIIVTWKFELFRKCFTEGRMEIRAHGVQSMQKELVENLYTKYMCSKPSGWADPLAQYVADLILSHKLVEYFVGVESHPQLIGRCGNIIGFLVVTRRYTEAETDTIWKAVCTSQDSRIVDAILGQLKGVAAVAKYQTLLYLTTKLNELPLQRFEGTLIEYGQALLNQLLAKWKVESPDSQAKLDLQPYQMCVRLIRQSAANGSLAPKKQREIVGFATSQLKALLQVGPSDTDREKIYENCVKDISSGTQFVTGSLSAILALLGDHPEGGISSLASTYGISSLVMGEFASSVETGSLQNLTGEALHEHLTPRLSLLAIIISCAPQSIDRGNEQKIWNFLLGPQSLSGEARDMAWTMLAGAVKACTRRNPFIDRCLSTYLPALQPSAFATRHSLSFLEQVIQYESQVTDTLTGEEQPRPLGVDLLWHLSVVVPPRTIEFEVINKLVTHYLNLPNEHHSPRSFTESIYIDVVGRCIRQLTAAASKLKAGCHAASEDEDEQMMIVTSEEEIIMQRLSFTRSLLIMKEFVKGARSRPTFSPPRQCAPWQSPNDHHVKGKSMSIPYQTFSGSRNSVILRTDFGDEETLEDLFHRLRILSGFAEFTLIAGGRKLDLGEEGKQTLRELKIDEKSFLLVKKLHLSDSAPDMTFVTDLKPLEGEIMKHFATLYDLLTMENGLAKEMYDFLLTFPPHETVTSLVCAKNASIELAFPQKAPYQILYSMHALKSCLSHQLHNGTASQNFISHGVQLSARVLTSSSILGTPLATDVDLETAAGLVNCLLVFLKEPTSADLSRNYVANPSSFVDRLQSGILSALSYGESTMSKALACNCFAVLLEASLHCDNVWDSFRAADQCAKLLQRLLLKESREDIRKEIAGRLQGVCAALPTLDSLTSKDLESYFWGQFRVIVPRSLEYAENCQQFFEVAVAIFNSLDHMHRESLEPEILTKDWTSLLLAHRHSESIGSSNTDWAASGISSLLHCCVRTARSFKKPMHIGSDVTEKLFYTCLFPEIPLEREIAVIPSAKPLLHSQTRHDLYQVILTLSHDFDSHERLLGLVSGLLPQGEDSHAWSWGVAQISEEATYDVCWSVEGSKLVRSATGYPGLRNLSNTCYLNSLFTQLFMNVSFRDFMLQTNIADGEQTQKLLAETRKLFAFMQESVLKSVDPQGIADNIVTYDGIPIDVSVQMDVDEFFNLLFDRWESQILSDKDKKAFRNMYGGQIVQQIKSKECPHISERLEPFSAIQCDIQGKATLKESLDAYVSGEVMEGGEFHLVDFDETKLTFIRACLKDIPDNLIFHLKRFDYDLMTGLRSKINDRFEFPPEVDMTPYNVAFLKDPEQSFPPDVFELVGVLVHSGTAESGHYYSYIRERPTNPKSGATWVEYNDAEISPFDPTYIGDQCFGGFPDPYAAYPKHNNAYMLFYQRKQTMASDIRTYRPSASGLPVKVELPAGLSDRIALENAIFTRKYCLHDSSYASFAAALLEQLSQIKKGVCSSAHLVERDSIWLAFKALDQVFSRAKDYSGFDKMLGSLTRVIGKCTKCCKIALDWVASSQDNIRNMLLRCPTSKVRKVFATTILKALRYLHEDDPLAYGLYIDNGTDEARDEQSSGGAGAFLDMVRHLREQRKNIAVHSRAWDDYFGLIAEMARFGGGEAYVLVREGFIKHCLEFLTVEQQDLRQPLSRDNNGHLRQYLRLIERGRKYSLHRLIELLRILLEYVDVAEEPLEVDDYEDRPILNGKAPLSSTEDYFLRLGSPVQRPKTLFFLEKIISSDCNRAAAWGIVRTMLAPLDSSLLSATQKTILSGVNIEPATLAAPFLDAALAFCEYCPNSISIKDVIKHIALEVDTIGLNGGQVHLEFFANVRRLSNAQAPMPQKAFHRLVLRTVPHWAPPLIMYWEENVRLKTTSLLRSLVFAFDTENMDNEQEAHEIEKVGRELCEACVKRIEDHIIEPQKPVDSKHVESVAALIRHCLTLFCQGAESYHAFTVHAETVLDSLQTLIVAGSYDAASDTWNDDNSTNPTDSESETIDLPNN